MAGEQSLDRMGGFRRVLPFTFAAFVIGGLALSGIPPLSGFFSKDDILLQLGARGGWHWALYVLGYIGALLTAIYTFRLIFRAFWGEPVPEAVELEHGHLHHPEQPKNPMTGEVEDNDVGFPGPGHFIAERELPMRIAMGALAVLSVIGGIVAIPKATFWLEHFLAPTFADSRIAISPSDGLLAFGLVLGAVLGVAGIAAAYYVWVAHPGTAAQLRERFAPLYRLFVNKWYFDELIDALVVRPGAWFGRFAQQTFERVVVNGALVGGTVGIVRAGSAAVRAVQSGMLRLYAGLLVVGVAAVTLYFLLRT
jgi:NADH-quinone oxidoreductase subunit L